ncbi:MAG TPA: hypothetical protein VF557_15230 [Jatrophihabitans sp.]|jgi:hypothetical protein|uniref:hypothetical protein n=1 Tax=Jatrophihabitans sp. TaxID=1932789 RepID=UPI002F0FE33F
MLDTSVAPIGERRLQAILDEVIRGGDAAETDYLEAKSDVDLQDPLGLAKVAKFILGAANRPPAKAQRHFRGHAVMVIGAHAGAAPGVATGCEWHELSDKLGRYLGRPGPAFDLARLPAAENREVLFIIVDPPEQGQLGFPCHRDFNPANKADSKHAMRNGELYIRTATSTRAARAEEVHALFQRALATSTAAVDLAVSVSGNPARVDRAEEFRDSVIAWAAEEYQTRSSTLSAGPPWPSAAMGKVPTSRRSPEEIQLRIDAFTADIKQRWPQPMNYLIGFMAGGLGFTIINEAGWLSKPRIDLTFHGCYGVDWQDPQYPEFDEITPLVDPVWDESHVSGLNLPMFRRTHPVSWKNTAEALHVIVSIPELRPGVPWVSDDNDVVAVARDLNCEQVRVTWVATAEGVGQQYTGELTVHTGPVIEASELFRTLKAQE